MIPRYRPPLTWKEVTGLFLSASCSSEPLEQAFCERYGYRNAVWFPYGRVAVQAFLECLGSRARTVAVSPFNCVALGNAIVSANWQPHYVDTVADGFSEDPDQFLDALSEQSCGAGIPVSLWGIPSDPRITQEAQKPLLHDFAHRTPEQGRPMLREQDAVMFSLSWGKPLATVRGAFLCGDSREQARLWQKWREERLQRAQSLRLFLQAAAVRATFSPFWFGVVHWLVSISHAGDRFSGEDAKRGRLMPVDWDQGPSHGLIKIGLKRIEQAAQAKREIEQRVRRYVEALARFSGSMFHLPPPLPLSHFALRVEDRDGLCQWLLNRGVFTSPNQFDKLLCDYPWLSGGGTTELPRARRLTRTTLHLPLYIGLTDSFQDRVSQWVSEWAHQRAAEPLGAGQPLRQRILK